MSFNIDRYRQYLKESNLLQMFIGELGWDQYYSNIIVTVSKENYILNSLAQKRGMVVFIHDGKIPDYPTRRKIEREVTKIAHEHLIVFINSKKTTQIWQWVKREAGKPTACREHTYNSNQPGDALIRKLQTIVFSLEEEDSLTITQVTGRARAAFDVERITKRFYDRFKDEHGAFLKFIKGIPDEELQRWYVSVMLNRLMFVYFIQKKGFLNGDINYLQNKLTECKKRNKDSFYREFLCPLFFEGFARKPQERSASINKILGKVPYLNGGIFQKHQIEELYDKQIQVSDKAFERLFEFFEQYQWYLDERPLRADNEINPDVLGYIFEKYVNQKQMGAYYTKEDITGYISKSTIIPYLFETAKQKCKIAFEGEKTIWELLKVDPDRYIYESIKKGVTLPLPSEVAVGLQDVSKRTEWNKPAPEEYALPIEIWREVVTRRKRYEEIRKNLANGEIRDINDFITLNLEIRQFAQDVVENCEGPELLRAFWHAIENITVLDPTCGSGAFLFAALNILEPLYEACLDRMEVFIQDLERSNQKHRPEKYSDFRKILERISQHPNRRYFIYKSIIINNLYGVDIMEESVEICKLRLFLKLVAQVDREEQIEPLPDIDFNIKSGNTLVGYATSDEVRKVMKQEQSGQMLLVSREDIDRYERFNQKMEDLEKLFEIFRQQQTELGGEITPDDKKVIRERFKSLENELNIYIAKQYGVDVKRHAIYEKWVVSHKPFHWFIEFYRILKTGGFDVIIGNPPYVEYCKIRNIYAIKGFETEDHSNLYGYVFERSLKIINKKGKFGMIFQLSLISKDSTTSLQSKLLNLNCWIASFGRRPCHLFQGADIQTCIVICSDNLNQDKHFYYSTKYLRWYKEERTNLFFSINYSEFLKKHYIPGRIPKFNSQIELSVLDKILKSKYSLINYLRKIQSKNIVIIKTMSERYFNTTLDFIPIYKLENNNILSSTSRIYYTDDYNTNNIITAVLNSNCFWWFFEIYSDCWQLSEKEIGGFRINDIEKLDKLIEINKILMENYKNNSIIQPIRYKKHSVEQQLFYPYLSKSIIDEIDKVLAEHYGFTKEELDFIINYDIKYRMGTENEADAEE